MLSKLILRIVHITFLMIWLILKYFDLSLIRIDKKSYKHIGIYKIGYITIQKTDDYESINSVNLLCLLTGKTAE